MRRTLSFLISIPRRILVGLVRTYQYVLSPHVGSTCRFTPSCSEYAVEALQKYGAARGTVLTVHRLLRCHPWGGHGYDPPTWYGEAPQEPGGTSAAETYHETEDARVV